MRPWSTDILSHSRNGWIFVLLSKSACLTQERGQHSTVSLAHPGAPCCLHRGFLQLSSWVLHDATGRQPSSLLIIQEGMTSQSFQTALQRHLLLLLECVENPDNQCSIWAALPRRVSRFLGAVKAVLCLLEVIWILPSRGRSIHKIYLY